MAVQWGYGVKIEVISPDRGTVNNPQPSDPLVPVSDYETALESLKNGGKPDDVLKALLDAEQSLSSTRNLISYHLTKLEDHIAYVKGLIK